MTTKITHLLIGLLSLLFLVPSGVAAQEAPQFEEIDTAVLGIHMLHTYEFESAADLLRREDKDERWSYVTIPLTLADLEKPEEWQAFFDKCKKARLIPLVRLATAFEEEAWIIPSKKNIVDQISFLGKLEWPTQTKHIIVFNEVNHAWEWEGTLDPEGYARVLRFTSQWARTEQKDFFVLAAAMDLAAPSGYRTEEAFRFWREALEFDPELFETIDGWNSHSYPNPGFVASPYGTNKMSIRGFEHELDFFQEYDERQLKVYITETGWKNTPLTRYRLNSYYEYAMINVWSDERVETVTPFVLMGDPGPFSEFSFFEGNGTPTYQYIAFKKALRHDL